MKAALRVLLVEDDRLQAKALRLLVQELGYEPVGVAATAPEAETMFEELQPDLVLLDIQLRGTADGIDVARSLNRKRAVPLIFLTSDDSGPTFERAVAAGPYAFLIKPYDAPVLARAIELAVTQYARTFGSAETGEQLLGQGGAVLVPGALYVRENSRLYKVHFEELRWLEADDTYVHLHTLVRKHTVRVSLRELEGKLPPGNFVRIRRGTLVQAAAIGQIDLKENRLWVDGHELAIGRTYRDDLLARLRLVG